MNILFVSESEIYNANGEIGAQHRAFYLLPPRLLDDIFFVLVTVLTIV